MVRRRVLADGGAWIHRLASVRPAARRGLRRVVPGQLLHLELKDNVAHSRPHRVLRSCFATASRAGPSRGRRDSIGLPGPANRPSVRPGATTETSVLGAINVLELGHAHQGARFPGLDQRGIRRPRGLSPARELPRHVNPLGPRAATTRASAARRPFSSIITGRTACRSASPGSSTPMARACTRTTARVVSNSCSSLRATSRSRSSATAATRAFCFVDDMIEAFVRFMALSGDVPGPINLGNPQEVEHARAGRADDPLTGSKSRIETPSASRRRSRATLPRHLARREDARLDAQGAARGGT